jgi:hypothetical protein
MKKLFFLTAILLFSFTLNAQEQNLQEISMVNNNIHSPGDVSFSFSGNRIMNEPFGSEFCGGIKMRFFIGKKISFDSDLVFGKDYTHFGPGVIGIPLMLLSNTFESDDNENSGTLFLIKLALILLSTEHIAYHFPVKNNTDISPFISALRLKQFKIDDANISPEDNYAHASFAAGLELNQYFKRFVLSPYAEYNISYDGYLRGFNFGVSFGYYFPERKK